MSPFMQQPSQYKDFLLEFRFLCDFWPLWAEISTFDPPKNRVLR
jgi:hypothetical protein